MTCLLPAIAHTAPVALASAAACRLQLLLATTYAGLQACNTAVQLADAAHPVIAVGSCQVQVSTSEVAELGATVQQCTILHCCCNSLSAAGTPAGTCPCTAQTRAPCLHSPADRSNSSRYSRSSSQHCCTWRAEAQVHAPTTAADSSTVAASEAGGICRQYSIMAVSPSLLACSHVSVVSVLKTCSSFLRCANSQGSRWCACSTLQQVFAMQLLPH